MKHFVYEQRLSWEIFNSTWDFHDWKIFLNLWQWCNIENIMNLGNFYPENSLKETLINNQINLYIYSVDILGVHMYICNT